MQHTDLDLQDELYGVDAVCGCKEDFISKCLRAIMPIPVRKRSHTNFTQKKKLCFLVMPDSVYPSPDRKRILVQGFLSKTLSSKSQYVHKAYGVSCVKNTPQIRQISTRKKVSLNLCYLCSGCL